MRANDPTPLHTAMLDDLILQTDLGVFGKSLVDGQGGPGGDLALVGTFFVVALVGTFASQVADKNRKRVAQAKY